MIERLTIYDIKKRYNTDDYFSTKSLKSVGLTLKSFKVYRINNQWYMLYIFNGRYEKIKYYDALNNILVGEYTYNQSTDSTQH